MGIISLAILLMNNYSVQANDFESNQAHYQRLCARRSSFQANLRTCQAFENYLKESRSQAAANRVEINQMIEQIKDDIQKLNIAIVENGRLIEQKEAEIKRTEEEIKITMENIAELEADIADRLANAQTMYNENILIDFLMNADTLDDFLIKIEGVRAINRANNDAIQDLADLKETLELTQIRLDQEKKELEEAIQEQNRMLSEAKTREAELFVQLEQEHRRQAQFNRALDNINIDDIIESSNGMRIPVNSGWISAIAWYYPQSFGGGWHPGLDIAANTGTPIVSPANGVVLMTASVGFGYGNHIVTAHQIGNDTYTFIHAHLSRFANTGATISQGQTIGFVGSTGFSTGPHLHLEIFRHRNRTLQQVVDTFRANGDLYFGLGYTSVGNCSNVCRLKPHEVFNVSMGQALN
jgi:murein DD-endopeptidase MepM/ murein hydrolase activator NlpD